MTATELSTSRNTGEKWGTHGVAFLSTDGESKVTDEELFRRGTIAVHRLLLAPGEAMPWHRDPYQRVAVVMRGDILAIEYRDENASLRVEVRPGQVEWEESSGRIHRAVNIGEQTYEQITIFLLDRPEAVAQPHEE